MAGFSFESGGKRCIRPILEKYQQGKVTKKQKRITRINQSFENFGQPPKGESEGYIVKTKEKNFPISHYPLEQTEFFYEQKQGTARFT